MPHDRTPKPPPSQPIGRILWTQLYGVGGRQQHHPRYKDGYPRREDIIVYEKVCECKGFSDDRPFSVFRHKDPKDPKPFKVVYSWRFPAAATFTWKNSWGQTETDTDDDDYYRFDILQEHTTKTAAQKAMRQAAAEAFAPQEQATATAFGAEVHARLRDWTKEYDYENPTSLPLHIGDLVKNPSGREGVVYRVVSERRKDDDWYTRLEPVFYFLNNHVPKPVELGSYAVFHHVFHLTVGELQRELAALNRFVQGLE